MHREIQFGQAYANLNASQTPEGMVSVFTDGYFDEAKDLVKREGLTIFATASGSAAIDGIYETEAGSPGTVLVATGGTIYKKIRILSGKNNRFIN